MCTLCFYTVVCAFLVVYSPSKSVVDNLSRSCSMGSVTVGSVRSAKTPCPYSGVGFVVEWIWKAHDQWLFQKRYKRDVYLCVFCACNDPVLQCENQRMCQTLGMLACTPIYKSPDATWNKKMSRCPFSFFLTFFGTICWLQQEVIGSLLSDNVRCIAEILQFLR